jgi:hypothetical protein
MANDILTQVLTDETTAVMIDSYLSTTIYDQVAKDTTFGRLMMENPYNKSVNGGLRFKIPMRVGKTDGLEWFGEDATFNPTRHEVLQWAYGTFKQAAANVRFSWLESRAWASKDAILDALKARIDATVQDCKEDFRTVMWGDGTGHGGKDMMGMQGYIPNDPRSGVVLGRDRSLAANGFWKPWYWDGTTQGPLPTDTVGGAPTSIGAFGAINAGLGRATGLNILIIGWESTQAGENPSDCYWISDQATYGYYARGYPIYGDKVNLVVDPTVAKWNVGGATLMGAPWIYDTTANGAPSGEVRLINKKYFFLVKDSGAWWVWTDWREPFNQPGSKAKYMFIRGETVVTDFRKHAVFSGLSAWA